MPRPITCFKCGATAFEALHMSRAATPILTIVFDEDGFAQDDKLGTPYEYGESKLTGYRCANCDTWAPQGKLSRLIAASCFPANSDGFPQREALIRSILMDARAKLENALGTGVEDISTCLESGEKVVI